MASLISPQIRKQYFDSNGDPLSGGKLHVYESGTTTPVDSYVDAAETSTNTNPIVLDSRGEIPGLFLRVGSYKFVLTDSADVTIWTKDNITIRDVGTELDDLAATVTVINTSITASVAVSRVVSGKASANSSRARYLIPIGSTNQVKILATATPLTYVINDTSYTISADIVASGLVSPPTTNNTALVNDSNLADGEETKTLGEFGSFIPYDTAGSEITGIDGQVAGFKLTTAAGDEYFIGRVDNTNSVIKDCERGLFYNNSGNPIERIVFADNDTLTLQKLSWVFLKTDGTMLISYSEPFHGATQPTSPNDGDMWRDTTTGVWKRFNSTIFVDSEALLIGTCIQDENGNTVAARSEDFYGEFSDINTLETEVVDSTSLRSITRRNEINVYGNKLTFNDAAKTWNIATHLEGGESEAASTFYYSYVKENGDSLLSPHAPLDNRGDLKGFYHPYEAWRCVSVTYNDSSSDLDETGSLPNILDVTKVRDFKHKEITGSMIVSPGTRLVLADATSGALTVQLPSASLCYGEELTIKKIDSSVNAVTIDGNGSQTIDGNTTYQIIGQYALLKIISDGSNWLILKRPDIPQVAFIEDQKSSGTGGGTSSTTPVARDLNTLSGDYLAMDITLDGTDGFKVGVTGEYLIEWKAPNYDGGNSVSSKSALYDETNTAYLKGGTNTQSGSTGGTVSYSFGQYRGNIEAETVLAIFHESTSAVANGWGLAMGGSLTIDSGAAANEVYTSVKVTKLD